MSNKITQNEKQLVNKVIQVPLSDDIIHKYLPKAKIIKYAELAKYRTIEELLSNNKAYVIILLEDSPNKGHWLALARYNNKIIFFDPYGGKIDSQLNWNSQQTQQALGQSQPLLSNLCNNTNMDVIYNPVDYQKESQDVNTCGRHVCFFIMNMLKYDRDLNQYYKMMQKLKKQTGMNYDQIVAAYINKV